MEDRIPNISENDIARIIHRDFVSRDRDDIMKLFYGRTDYRVLMAILKLSDGQIDQVIEKLLIAETDDRDVLAPAEYPRFVKIGFVGLSKLSKEEAEKLYEDDWQDYLKWLNQ